MIKIDELSFELYGADLYGKAYRDTDVIVEKCDKHVKKVAIPSKIDVNGKTYDVTAIRSNAFSGCTDLEEVIIPDSIRAIDAHASS